MLSCNANENLSSFELKIVYFLKKNVSLEKLPEQPLKIKLGIIMMFLLKILN